MFLLNPYLLARLMNNSSTLDIKEWLIPGAHPFL